MIAVISPGSGVLPGGRRFWRLRHVGHVRYLGELLTRILRHGTGPPARYPSPERREGSVLGQLAGTAFHRPRCGPRDDIDVLQTLLGHLSPTSMTTTSTPGTGKASEAVVVAELVAAECDTDRLG